jgi:hypothetical protein
VKVYVCPFVSPVMTPGEPTTVDVIPPGVDVMRKSSVAGVLAMGVNVTVAWPGVDDAAEIPVGACGTATEVAGMTTLESAEKTDCPIELDAATRNV